MQGTTRLGLKYAGYSAEEMIGEAVDSPITRITRQQIATEADYQQRRAAGFVMERIEFPATRNDLFTFEADFTAELTRILTEAGVEIH